MYLSLFHKNRNFYVVYGLNIVSTTGYQVLTSAKLVMAFALYTHHHHHPPTHHHINYKSLFLSPLWSDLSM